jgi:transcriptional repressor NrdR
MICPLCHSETKVIDSRAVNNDMAIRRRRECIKCRFRFSTHEQIELLDLLVIKKDGTREAYRRSKLESGLRRALEKRSVTEENFQKLVTAIEVEIQKKNSNEISSQTIGQIVMNQLRDFDSVAYIRFASVYKSFDDLQSFHSEINKIKNIEE